VAEVRVRLESLSRHYGSLRALDDVDLEIRAGEWLAVMGPSGSGKSTLVNLLGALDRPTAGSVWVDGQEITRLPEPSRVRFRREKVGIIFQQFHLLPYLNALENVMVAQHYHSMADAREAMEALERVGMADRARHLPSQLSGGEQQRVCVARALINRPRLVLADEPTGNLDPGTGAAVFGLLRALQRERAFALVVATHSGRIAHGCDRMLRLTDGRLRAMEDGEALRYFSGGEAKDGGVR
jgi:putative ABC transport system ATP-binding protein